MKNILFVLIAFGFACSNPANVSNNATANNAANANLERQKQEINAEANRLLKELKDTNQKIANEKSEIEKLKKQIENTNKAVHESEHKLKKQK